MEVGGMKRAMLTAMAVLVLGLGVMVAIQFTIWGPFNDTPIWWSVAAGIYGAVLFPFSIAVGQWSAS